MAPSDAKAALQGTAQAIYDAARDHKRQERHHRQQAQALRRELDEFRVALAEFGITLVIDTQTR